MKNTTEFQTALSSFLVKCNEMNAKYMAETFPSLPVAEILPTTGGKKYMRVVQGTSVFCFVDLTNGNVLKAAGWKAPAKHSRGNILDESNGMSKMGPYGPAYMK